ncbi:MAG TPA: hypothetical protein VGY56_21835 [Verrucomicrobiae bacterium]|nr:hypothetical protein [Verrucomicrobiae bacterium]
MPTANITSSGYNFGRGGYSNYQRIQLPQRNNKIPGQNKFDNEDSASHFRRGILFYFGNCILPARPSRSDKLTTGSKGLYRIEQVVSKTVNVKNASPSAVKLADMVSQAMADAPAWASTFAAEAANEIKSKLPAVMQGMLSAAGNVNVPGVSNVIKIGTNLKTVIKKGWTLYQSSGIEQALRSGEPILIVNSLRKQLSDDVKVAMASVVYHAAQVIAATLTSGVALAVTQLVDSLVQWVAYIWDLFRKIFDRILLRTFFIDCESRYLTNDKIIFDITAFKAWYSKWVSQLPIISAHCLCSKITGSYFGYLSTVVEGEALKSAYGGYVSLQARATEYARDYYYHFSSHNALVRMSLTATQSGGVDLTNGAAAQSVGRLRRFANWLGSSLGVTDNTLYSAAT